ncbi:YqaA family protein [Pseudomonadota bacterium AL_CKDN230030165-1A_HGKHYDSX7]
MEETLLSAVHGMLGWLALPTVGLGAVFLICLVSATLLPLGSEAVVFGYLKLQPDMFWATVLVATLGNTLGGVISYGMGWWAHRALERWREKHPHEHSGPAEGRGTPASGGTADAGAASSRAAPAVAAPAARPGPVPVAATPAAPTSRFGATAGRWNVRAHAWLHRLGPPALLLSWLPAVGDPLCAVAGWLRLPFWPSVFYIAVGKFLRYVILTAGLLWVL